MRTLPLPRITSRRSRTRLTPRAIAFALLLAAGCQTSGPGTDDTFPDEDVPIEAGVAVQPKLAASVLEEKALLDAALANAEGLDPAGFAERSAVDFTPLSYEPKDALGIDLLQASTLSLTAAELAKLDEQGFVISSRQEFPTFSYGYSSIYADDLPLFVSADSILYAMHHSYDKALQWMESGRLIPELAALLDAMSEQNAQMPESERSRDLDVYLTVARSLLKGSTEAPGFASSKESATEMVNACAAASGVKQTQIFGVSRKIDFSQCQPRGHYIHSEALEQYFRAMIWLGRIDFRILETQPDGSQLFHRRQLEGAIALASLVQATQPEKFKLIDDVIGAFVGEHDYMRVAQAEKLLSDLQVDDIDELASLDDETLAQAIVDGQYGTQRISSHYMVNGLDSGTLPLSSSFALFGQRYVIDSHVFSNLVYDRVRSSKKRLMPSSLDVAYAALQNDQAGSLLSEEISTYGYHEDLARMRIVVDHQAPSFWEQNLYNRWLAALRVLSPSKALIENESAPLPAVARTEAWGRRLLSTQLSSWAELRRNTVLYAKQSYSAGIACEFPDAYVDPYPQLFTSIQAFADHAASISLAFGGPENLRLTEHFEHFSQVAGMLSEMAEHQRTGTPHSEEHLAFINEAVQLDPGCGDASAFGWYPRLFLTDSLDLDPTVADVHTQPEDEAGNSVGRVLHVATGYPRLMVMTAETCEGPRAYVGLASSFHEHITEDWLRLDDPAWAEVLALHPPSPDWLTPITAE